MALGAWRLLFGAEAKRSYDGFDGDAYGYIGYARCL